MSDDARAAILRAVRAARPAPVARPDVRAAVQGFAGDACETPDDRALSARFAEAARAGGSVVVEGRRGDLPTLVAAAVPGARRVVSQVDGIVGAVPMPDTPHGLADADLFVCEAVLGVAENGAVWLPLSRLGERAAPFIAAHVAVVLDRTAIVADMHAAYARLDVAAERFGVFVAGPSKTADIEQSLVVGAHGPKEFTVVLIEIAPAP
ncbi:MAG TPA: LUD domain-containing protein [Gemmatirosa sp.]